MVKIPRRHALNLAISFSLNYSEIPNSCFWQQLSFLINMREVLVHTRPNEKGVVSIALAGFGADGCIVLFLLLATILAG